MGGGPSPFIPAWEAKPITILDPLPLVRFRQATPRWQRAVGRQPAPGERVACASGISGLYASKSHFSRNFPAADLPSLNNCCALSRVSANSVVFDPQVRNRDGPNEVALLQVQLVVRVGHR